MGDGLKRHMAGPSGLDIRRRSVGIKGWWLLWGDAGLLDLEIVRDLFSVVVLKVDNKQPRPRPRQKNMEEPFLDEKAHRRTILGRENMVDSESSLRTWLCYWQDDFKMTTKCFPCMPTKQARAAWDYGLHAVCGGLAAWWLWRLIGHLGEFTGTRRCQEAQAVGVALDYRKLDEIDPSTRQRFFLQKVESDPSLNVTKRFISATTVGNKEITINTVML